MSKKLSQQIGEFLAHFQDLTDTVYRVVVKRVRTSKRGDKLADKIVDFISETGDHYFEKYHEIKKKNGDDK